MTAGTRAFRQFVLKVHSRCDLACDHCYIYEHADQSWRRRPRVMPDEVTKAVVSRIAEHARAHPELPRVHVILHGGEPLLAGRERLARIARDLRTALDGVCALDLRMQTNGLRLDEDSCRMLVREGISTGVSLDGDRAANDRHRKRADGTGSYDAVVRAVRLLGSAPHRAAFAGLLCTVDPANDPLAVYEALAALDPPRVDFLLPHATWDRPPRGGAAHARWLITVYDRWRGDGRPFPVRVFDSIEAGRDGQESFTEALGLGSPDLVVVETDGEIEQADWLKTVGQGAPGTGFHVLRHSFDEAAAHPGFLVRHGGVEALSRQCRDCSVVRICGGGLYGHRHRAGNGFDNPSVYCEDLFRLIGHVLRTPRPEPVSSPHTLTAHGFDSLAAGDGDADALSALVTAEASARRILLAAVCARHPGPEASALTRLDRHRPRESAATVRHPHLGTWAVRALEGRLPAAAVRLRLGEIAAATALRSGRGHRLALPEGTGQAHLPGIGRLTLRPGHGPAELIAREGELLIARGPGHDPLPLAEAAGPEHGIGWEPVRRLTVGAATLLLEDGDPHRDGFPAGPAPRPDAAEYARWARLFAEAGPHLSARYPHRLPGIRALLATCTPLCAPHRPGRAAVDPHAFGALGIVLPSTAEELADLLVEGVQQLKFNALLDLFDLAGSDESTEHLRSAYLDRPPAHAISLDGLTAYGRRMAVRLRG
ncbi:FxsB family cyclophane-forming radical SAM/SPASM peptide maturase [Streptomyces sp. NPDC101175]|uniref:FxsB family cyclophane-forming radical SAM/SPASM peptide maturase n=1 Tax=Streptomyces sp. NPDC101175 TaxID=3366123 RepID=UPI003839AF56